MTVQEIDRLIELTERCRTATRKLEAAASDTSRYMNYREKVDNAQLELRAAGQSLAWAFEDIHLALSELRTLKAGEPASQNSPGTRQDAPGSNGVLYPVVGDGPLQATD